MITFIQFLIEAREHTIAQAQGAKILATYNQKESNQKFNNALDLINSISTNTNPKYIQWTTNQYIKDPSFTLNKLPKIKSLLTKFELLSNKKKIQPITNFNIHSLEQTLNKFQDTSFDSFTNKFYETFPVHCLHSIV